MDEVIASLFEETGEQKVRGELLKNIYLMDFYDTDNQDLYNKSNIMISSKYKTSLLTNKLFALSQAHMGEAQFELGGNLVQIMSAAEIRKRLNIKGNNIYAQLKTVANQLTGQTIGYTDEENQIFDYIAIITRCTYANGKLRIEYNKDVIKYLVDIQKNYTRLPLSIMLAFENNHAFRLYEVLRSKMYYGKNNEGPKSDVFKISLSLAELKITLGIVNANLDKVKKVLQGKKAPDYEKAVAISPEKQYEDWYEFYRWVLMPAITEINEISDITVEFEKGRENRGGKVTTVTFYCRKKGSKGLLENEEEDDIVIPEKTEEEKQEILYACIDLIEEKIKIADAKAICEAANYNMFEIQAAYQIAKDYKKPIANLTAFLIKVITEPFPEPVPMNKNKQTDNSQNKFCNYNQREYDEAELEAKLLYTGGNEE